MKRRTVFAFCLFFLFFGIVGCGLEDEPIPSPHAVVLINPSNSSGEQYLFASNRFLDRVYRINTRSLNVDEIKVGAKPRNITANPDGTLVAVANEAGKSISIIATESLQTWKVSTGYEPRDIRFSPDGAWLAVANYKNETVSLIHMDNKTLQSQIWVGGGPVSLDFDPTSAYVAVVCYNEDAVRVIDVEEKKVIFDWQDDELLDRPQAVVFGHADSPAEGLLFVGCRRDPDDPEHESYADSIAVFHLTERWYDNHVFEPEIEIIRSGPNPRGFGWTQDGDKLLAINHVFEYSDTYDVDTLSVLDIVRGEVDESYRIVVGDNPVALARAPEVDMFAVANKDGGSVTVVDLDEDSGSYQATASISTEINPYALAFSPDGRKVVVVHETPLMPVSVVDLDTGKSKVVYRSVGYDDWIE